jgi:hypothetical protein
MTKSTLFIYYTQGKKQLGVKITTLIVYRYQWLQLVPSSQATISRSAGPELVLDSVAYTDQGDYICEAFNTIGNLLQMDTSIRFLFRFVFNNQINEDQDREYLECPIFSPLRRCKISLSVDSAYPLQIFFIIS